VKDRIAEFEERVVGSVSPVTDPAGALQEIARVCVHIATRNNLRRFILTLMVEALDTNPQLSQAFRGIMRLPPYLPSGASRQREGTVRADVDARAAAAMIAGHGRGIQHYQVEQIDLRGPRHARRTARRPACACDARETGGLRRQPMVNFSPSESRASPPDARGFAREVRDLSCASDEQNASRPIFPRRDRARAAQESIPEAFGGFGGTRSALTGT
jgi:hypothetical protein